MNIYKFSTALLATIIATACSEMITPEVPEGAGQITVTAKVGVDVKAGYDSKTLPGTFFMSINQGSDESFNYDLTMTKAEDNIYRANRDQLRWASSNHGNVLVNAITLPSVSGESVQINLTGEQNTEDKLNANDILGAKSGSGVTISGDNIDISFKHLMSKLHVVYESDDNITVTSIMLKNVSMGGVFNFATMSSISSYDPNAAEINMYLNAGVQYGIKAAEAIFYPYKPSESVKPSLIVTANVNGTKMISDPIEFAQNVEEFNGGKRYMVKLQVKAEKVQNLDKLIAEVSSLSTNDWVKNVPGGKILWVGTSIPAGAGTNNYPQMIANATGLEVINNAVGGSVFLKARSVWVEALTKEYWSELAAGGFSQTTDEAKFTYEDRLKNWFGAEEGLVKLSNIQALSYESLLIPYINGSKANCQTVVIDHGFNDIDRILYEAGAFMGFDSNQTLYSETYFNALLQGTPLSDGNGGTFVPSYDHYKLHLKSNAWDKGVAPYQEDSYLLAMEHVITECRKVNPNINIIIGNYYAKYSSWIHWRHYQGGLLDFQLTKAFCNYNRAAAHIFDCKGIVNVYDYLDVTDEQLWSGNGYVDPVYGYTAYPDESKFCPDGLHPSSDETGNSNRQIADIYLQELAKIFKTTTKSSGEQSHPATDNSWEDVELL